MTPEEWAEQQAADAPALTQEQVAMLRRLLSGPAKQEDAA